MKQDTVGEGRTSYHHYKLLKHATEPIPEDAVYIDKQPYVPVETVEALKYKVSDGHEDLMDWTNLPLETVGVIEVPGPINRISNRRKCRKLTLFAVHDGGKHLPMEISYTLVNYTGITADTVPKTQT